MKKTVLICMETYISQNIFYFKTENNERISSIGHLDNSFRNFNELMVENVIEFIGFSRIQIASFIMQKRNLFGKDTSFIIGRLKPSYNFNFQELIKNNKIAMFTFENNKIYVTFYDNNQIIFKKCISSVSDLIDMDIDIMFFKNLSNVQIASIKKVLNKNKKHSEINN